MIRFTAPPASTMHFRCLCRFICAVYVRFINTCRSTTFRTITCLNWMKSSSPLNPMPVLHFCFVAAVARRNLVSDPSSRPGNSYNSNSKNGCYHWWLPGKWSRLLDRWACFGCGHLFFGRTSAARAGAGHITSQSLGVREFVWVCSATYRHESLFCF